MRPRPERQRRQAAAIKRTAGSLTRAFSSPEVEVQQLQKAGRDPSFCGPEPEEAAGLDCISVSQENLEDLRDSGRTELPQRSRRAR